MIPDVAFISLALASKDKFYRLFCKRKYLASLLTINWQTVSLVFSCRFFFLLPMLDVKDKKNKKKILREEAVQILVNSVETTKKTSRIFGEF